MNKIISFLLVITLSSSSNTFFFGNNVAYAQEEEVASGAVSAILCFYDLSSAAGSAIASVLNVPVNSAIDNAQTGGDRQKECLMDSIGFVLKELLIKEITASTVRWINGGFEGKPQYVQDLGGFLEDTADAAIGEYIYNDENWNFLCAGIKPEIRLAAALNTYASTERKPRCTLSEVADNAKDLSVKWDWDDFNEYTGNPANSSLGGYIYVSENIKRTVENITGRDLDDINRGEGFLSHKKCETVNENGTITNEATGETIQGVARPVTKCRIVTPGSIIFGETEATIGSDQRRIELADEFNEVFAALVGQLIKKVLGDDGLESVSQAGTGSGGGSFLDDYESEVSEETLRQILDSVIAQYEAYIEKVETYEEQMELTVAARRAASEEIRNAYTCYKEKSKEISELDESVYQPWLLSNVNIDDKLTQAEAEGEMGSLRSFLLQNDGVFNFFTKPQNRSVNPAQYDSYQAIDYNWSDRRFGPTTDELFLHEDTFFGGGETEVIVSGDPIYAIDDIRNWGTGSLKHRANLKIEELKNYDFNGKVNEAGLNELLALARGGVDLTEGFLSLDTELSDIINRRSKLEANHREATANLQKCQAYTVTEEIAGPIECDPEIYQCAGDSTSTSSSSGSGSSSSGSGSGGGPVGGSV